jgi:hypothetical protein
MFLCFVNTQKVFDQVKSLLANFRADIEREQAHSTARCRREDVWMVGQINKAVALLTHRTNLVKRTRAAIARLEGRIKETNRQIKVRQDKIKENSRLLEQFKRERCANNLLFVKSLREHIEGIEILTLLRADLVAYFRRGRKFGWSLIEKVHDFEYLLDDEHKLVLSQLTTKLQKLPAVRSLHAATDSYTKVHSRTAAQIGTGQVDNTRGELVADKAPKHETVPAYTARLEKKVLLMVDHLIQHLKNSRDHLTRSEIKASEDFAIFQSNMFKENRYLAARIRVLQARLVRLNTRLNRRRAQLVRREKLRQEAETLLRNLRRMRAEKRDYCVREDNRRRRELSDVGDAQSIFQKVLDKLSMRVKIRTQSNAEGRGYGRAGASKEVVSAAGSTTSGLDARVKSRAELAY